eukprot:m.69627 g.69627  ORF g.69627 m.69627 type:complete len:309 (+) comp24119_c0_seq2:235-1161(+)
MEDCGRLFLQMIMKKQFISADEIIKLARTATLACGQDALQASDFPAFLSVINSHLTPLDMRIQSIESEVDGNKFYALTNDVGDTAAALATELTKPQIELFRILVEKIVCGEGPVSKFEAMNTVKDLEGNMSKQQCQENCKQFVEDGWLCEPNAKSYSLGARAMMELDSYIRKEFGEAVSLRECMITGRLCMHGDMCSNCGGTAHFYALQKLFDSHRAKNRPITCPSCKADWLSQSQSNKSNANTNTHNDTENDVIEEDETENTIEETSEGPSASVSQSQSPTRRGKRRADAPISVDTGSSQRRSKRKT